jgi:hypothetical protein
MIRGRERTEKSSEKPAKGKEVDSRKGRRQGQWKIYILAFNFAK